MFTYLVRGKLGAVPLPSTRLASLHAREHSGAGPDQNLVRTRHAPGGKHTFLILIHDVMGREKRTTLPNLGVKEGFLKEMVLELFGKDIRESERRRGFQAEGAAQERDCGICPCKQLSLAETGVSA